MAAQHPFVQPEMIMKKIFIPLVLFLLAGVFVYAAAPTASGSNLTFNSIDGKSFAGSFTGGNGLQRLVVMREGSPVTGMPVNGVQYSPNGNFGTAGSEFTAAGEYVVQTSSWTSFSVSNLKPGTVYYVAIFEYNGTGSATEYLMVPLTGNRTTAVAPTTQAAFTATTNVTGNSVTLNWTNGNGNGRLVLARKGAPVNGAPVNLAFYYGDENFGNTTKIGADNYVIYRGNGSSAQVKNLEPNTTYHFAVFEFNGSNTPVYATASSTVSATTNTGPTAAATWVGFGWVEGNRFTISCSPGNGARRLFVMKKGSAVTAVPVNGAVYTANAAFGSGQEMAPGEYVVSAGAATGVALTNLEPGTEYHFRIYEYDADQAGNTYYLTTAYATKNGSTVAAPTVLASDIKIVTLTGSTASIGLVNGNGSYRTVLMKEGSPVDAAPVNFATYGSNASFGSGTQLGTGNYVLHWGINGSPFNVTNLKAGRTYHLSVFEFNGNGAPVYSAAGATFSFSVPAEPSAAARSPLIFFQDCGSFRFAWTNGNGSNRLVVAKKGSAPTFKPEDGSFYVAKSAFGAGESPAAGEFVVYNGTDNYVDLTRLEIGSTYHFSVFDYNLDGTGKPDYLTTGWLAATGSTLGYPTTQVTLLPVSNIQATSATVNFAKGNGQSRLFLMKEGSMPDSIPVDYRKYDNNTYGTPASHLGNGNYVVNKTSYDANFNVSNMKPKTTYYIAAYEFNGSAEPAYLRSPAATVSFTTADVPGATTPTVAASNAAVDKVEGNRFTFKWTNGNGGKRLVVMRKGSAVTFVPGGATDYPANAAFGSGIDLGNGQYAVYNGAGSSVDVTNLEPSTEYHFAVFEFNGTADMIRYLTSATLAAGFGTVTAPATPAGNVTASGGNGSMTLTWTPGSGAGRLIILKEGSAVTARPVNLSTYPANAVFKNGSQVAVGEYVVHAGAGNTLTVTGLANNIYHFAIFEYNGSAAPVYNTANAVSGYVVISSTLPVQLAGFAAKQSGNAVVLTWATLQEQNSRFFVVERSTDGARYAAIGTVAAAGNSAVRKDYTFSDKVLKTEKRYYRLRQVDADGRAVHSPVAVVDVKLATVGVSVLPNPVTSGFRVQLPNNGVARVQVYDAGGALRLSRSVRNGETVDASGLEAGVYTLLVVDTDRYATPFVKQ